MIETTFTFKSEDGLDIFTYRWMPEEGRALKGVIQIAHGMMEHAGRYKCTAEKLTEAGYIVYANDHRGHGRTAKEAGKLGAIGNDSFNLMVDDMHKLSSTIKEENNKLPLFLLGHSMGSFLAQRYIQLYGNELAGVIFSGSCGSQGIMGYVGAILAKGEINRHGSSTLDKKMLKIMFKGYNRNFEPKRTKSDWLTRDEEEVDKFIEDPLCGFNYTTEFFYDFLEGLKLIAKRKVIEKIPKDLPIYIFSGDKDPVGKDGKGILKLVKTYKEAGMKSITYKLYENGRHEMLHEINKDEVIRDLIMWLKNYINN